MKIFNILLLGSGGRESAILWKLLDATTLDKITITKSALSEVHLFPHHSSIPPHGNQVKILNGVHLEYTLEGFVKYCKEHCIDLVIPGSEQLLADGITDILRKNGVYCFGPTKAAAQIESSKAFSKSFMKRHNIPTAIFQTFTDSEKAKKYLQSATFPLVIKASGLALGKGVIIAQNLEESIIAIDQMMVHKDFGLAGSEVVIEEFLDGEEVSFLAFTDGYTIVPFPPSQDHKRIFDGDQGPNTGGMGAYAPVSWITNKLQKEIMDTVMIPTVTNLRREGMPFVGVLYAGLMIMNKSNDIKVLEFNSRLGDPETQALLPLMEDECDLASVILACVEGRLDSIKINFKKSQFSATVILSSKGYPGPYRKGELITIDSSMKNDSLFIFHAGTKVSNEGLVTNGGRVLAVTSISSALSSSLRTIYNLIGTKISFPGMQYRTDIGKKLLDRMTEDKKDKKGMTYVDAGVDIEAGNKFVEEIKYLTKRTARAGANASIGGFGGLFDLNAITEDKDRTMKSPLLVSATDGVGTKLFIAEAMSKFDTIGLDLVAMNVNDLLVQAAEPLYFLDYYATSHLNLTEAVEVIKGISDGCIESSCALIGGETAEMPGLYQPSQFDLAGFSVGIVDQSALLPKLEEMQAGDVLIGLSSSGFHSNGFSLIRHILKERGIGYETPFNEDSTLGQILLEPTRIYVPIILPVIKNSNGWIKGMSHITGGGFLDNIPRVLPPSLAASLDASTWSLPPIFRYFKELGNVSDHEMARTWNCGIGMILVTSTTHADSLIQALEEQIVNLETCTNTVMSKSRNKSNRVQVYKIGSLIKCEEEGKQVILNNTTYWN